MFICHAKRDTKVKRGELRREREMGRRTTRERGHKTHEKNLTEKILYSLGSDIEKNLTEKIPYSLGSDIEKNLTEKI